MRLTLLLPVVVVAAVATLAACPRSAEVGQGCTSDIDCGDSQRCDPNGVCLCVTDDACDASEFCNLAGRCQPKTECLTNDDCRTADNPTAICDTRAESAASTGGQCVTLSAQLVCLLDSHCPFGFYCDNQACVPGCRDNGDCAIGDPCLNNQCDPTPGACNDNGFCEFGEICNTSTNRCAPHREANRLCTQCDPFDLLDPCGTHCLIDQSIAPDPCTTDGQCAQGHCVFVQCLTDNDCDSGTCEGGGLFTPGRCTGGFCGDFFCGSTSCDDASDPCPRGYACTTVVLVSNNSCTRGGGQCQGGRLCSADFGGENNESGFCTCLSDTDCPIGTSCQDGGCVEGTTCGPSDGLLCSDVR